MSSIAPLSTVGEEKLKTERISDGNTTCVRFEGVMDESFEGKRLAASVRAKNVILDMGRIGKISSFGIREWSEFISVLTRNAENIYMIECTAKVMDQVNMVAGFIGKARIVSFYGPYRCDHCDVDRDVAFQVARDGAAIRAFEPPEQLCPSCARPQFFDEDPTSFFSTVSQQPQFDLERGVPEFLAAKLNYNITGGNRRLQIDKFVEGSDTYLRLSGNLDGAFSSEKVADGLEGRVVVDVSGLGGVDIAGAAEWRNFVTLARNGAKRLYLLDCPPVLLDRLPRTEDLGDEVISFSMPYNCTSCSTTTSEIVDVAEHFEILKFATPPEMRCGNCKQSSVCTAQESLLSRLRDLQKPTADAKLKSFIKVARKRKPAVQANDAAAAAGMVAGKKTMALAIATLTAVLGAAGLMIYNAYKEKDTTEELKAAVQEQLANNSQPDQDRPAWITSSNRFSGKCVEEIGSMVCVGISAYSESLDDAKAQARAAALDEAIAAMSISIESESFDSTIRPVYSAARGVLLDEVDRLDDGTGSAEYKALVTKVAEIRERSADALMASSNDGMPKQHAGLFWEKYEEDGKDPEYLAFTRYEISTAAQRAMHRIYSEEKEVDGGMVVTGYPLLAWSHSDFAGGVFVAKAEGPLAGTSAGSVITRVGEKAVNSALEFSVAMKAGGGDFTTATVAPAYEATSGGKEEPAE